MVKPYVLASSVSTASALTTASIIQSPVLGLTLAASAAVLGFISRFIVLPNRRVLSPQFLSMLITAWFVGASVYLLLELASRLTSLDHNPLIGIIMAFFVGGVPEEAAKALRRRGLGILSNGLGGTNGRN